MSNRYLTARGELRWEAMSDTLVDLCDGYLSNVEGISYEHGSAASGGLLELLRGDGTEEDVDPDMLGSRLLKTVSQLHSIGIDHTIKDKPEDDVLHRLSKFAPLASKLSDKYAMQDQMYQSQWHDDVLDICEAIATASGENQ